MSTITQRQIKPCAVCLHSPSQPDTQLSAGSSRSVPLTCITCSRTTNGEHSQLNENVFHGHSITPVSEEPEEIENLADDDPVKTHRTTTNIPARTSTSTRPQLATLQLPFPSKYSASDVLTPTTPNLKTPLTATSTRVASLSTSQSLNKSQQYQLQKQSLLDPVNLLTQVRMPSRGYDCIYPGALFEGMQTNKMKDHRVSVRITDVNFAQSTLSGFLTIHDLTPQHPEITTYFDGQIIGQQYGFRTNEWGANEQIDTAHWSKFPSYHHIHASELVKSKQTFKQSSTTLDRGFVFMRWKERFLVPDHKVRSINGASYDGFYYICVEFGSLMGGVHGDALKYENNPIPEVVDEEPEQTAESSDSGNGEVTENGEDEAGNDDNSQSRSTSQTVPIPTASTSTSASIRSAVGGVGWQYDDDKPPLASTSYGHTSTSPHAPSTSPVLSRMRRSSGAGQSRRRRLSIYSAGSVASQVQSLDHAHSHSHTHPYGYSTSSAHAHPAYGSSPPIASELGQDGEIDEEEMGLEEALELDPAEEMRRIRSRMLHARRSLGSGFDFEHSPRERYASSRSRSRSRLGSRERRDKDEMDEEWDERERAYAYVTSPSKRSLGHSWVGGGAARLTGYYAQKDVCESYQKLELRHVPEKTRGSFEFR